MVLILPSRRLLILVDMDDTIVDWEGGLLETYKIRHPGKFFIPLEHRMEYWLANQYPSELRPLVEDVHHTAGFYRELSPIPGAIKALREMRSLGHEVLICSSPSLSNPTGFDDKRYWIDSHLGEDWTRKLVLTQDKTIIVGDKLVDDKPDITGINPHPTWEHILYDQPYNRHIKDKRRLTWENYRGVLGI